MRHTLAALALAALAVAGFAPAAAADDDGPRVAPLDADGGYWQLDASPGDEFTVELAADAPSAYELELTAHDGRTSPVGGLVYPEDAPDRTGAWLDVGDPTELGPEPQRIPVTVSVPDDARPGDHVAGVGMVTTEAAEDTETLATRARRVIAVEVSVDGPADPEVVIDGPVFDDGELRIDTTNTGERLVAGDATVTVNGEDRDPFSIGAWHPGDQLQLPTRFDDIEDGGELTLTIDYGPLGSDYPHTAVWTGVADTGVEMDVDELEDRDSGGLLELEDGDTATWPLLLGAAALALLGLLLLLLLAKRRKDDEDAEEDDATAESPPTP